MATSHSGVPREVDRYLVPAEKVIFITRLHIVTIIEPILTVVIGFVLFTMLSRRVESDNQGATRNMLFLLWLALVLRLAYKLVEWYFQVFLSTDKRLILVLGVLNRRVNMMPLGKVTDMRYDQSIPGRVVGYGKFVLESAGQDQALSVVNWVPNPDAIYRKINATLFTPQAGAVQRPTPTGAELPVQEPGQAWWNRG